MLFDRQGAMATPRLDCCCFRPVAARSAGCCPWPESTATIFWLPNPLRWAWSGFWPFTALRGLSQSPRRPASCWTDHLLAAPLAGAGL